MEMADWKRSLMFLILFFLNSFFYRIVAQDCLSWSLCFTFWPFLSLPHSRLVSRWHLSVCEPATQPDVCSHCLLDSCWPFSLANCHNTEELINCMLLFIGEWTWIWSVSCYCIWFCSDLYKELGESLCCFPDCWIFTCMENRSLDYQFVLKFLWGPVGDLGLCLGSLSGGLIMVCFSLEIQCLCPCAWMGVATWPLHSAEGAPCVPCFYHSWCEQFSSCASHAGSAEQLVSWKVKLIGVQALPLCCCQDL